ncbi:MAG: hypothetical protein ACE5F1_03725 [Planctomycetota bacterium]
MIAVGTRRGFESRDHGQSIRFVESLNGLGSKRSLKGYLYSMEPPARIVESLDAYVSPEGRYEVYRRIGRNWYLFLRREE